MKAKLFITLALVALICQTNFAQDQVTDKTRFIEVTGSAEMYVEPDEIHLQIGIQEYWKEECEKGKEYKDFVTKIPLEEIEKNLLAELATLGITKSQLTLKEAGNTWEHSGKDFRKSKTYEITLSDVGKINEIISKVKTRGINSMVITELKNKNITQFRKQVKIEAIKSAKEKATYLLESVENKVGRLLSVIELNNSEGYIWRQQNVFSNSMMSGASTENSEENIRKIKLKHEIKTRFEIVD